MFYVFSFFFEATLAQWKAKKSASDFYKELRRKNDNSGDVLSTFFINIYIRFIFFECEGTHLTCGSFLPPNFWGDRQVGKLPPSSWPPLPNRIYFPTIRNCFPPRECHVFGIQVLKGAFFRTFFLNLHVFELFSFISFHSGTESLCISFTYAWAPWPVVSNPCFAGDSLVLMADGSHRRTAAFCLRVFFPQWYHLLIIHVTRQFIVWNAN